MTNNSNIFDRVVGSEMYVTLDLTKQLQSGQSLDGLPTLTLSNDYITEMPGTMALDPTHKMFSVKFDHVTQGLTRVDYSAPTDTPDEVITDWFFVRTINPPDGP